MITRERVVIMKMDDGLWVTEVLRHNVTLASGTARWNETLTQRADSAERVLTFSVRACRQDYVVRGDTYGTFRQRPSARGRRDIMSA